MCKKRSFGRLRMELPLHLMLLPGIILVFVFSYIPMSGIIIAFQKFIPSRGMFGKQLWIGLDNFRFVFSLPGFTRSVVNTIIIAFSKIVLGMIVPVFFAVLLNEITQRWLKRIIQTIIYMPYFLSWVVLGGIFIDIFSPTSGIVNNLLSTFGIEPVFFLGSNKYFRSTLILTHIWKEFGYGTIVYLAAIVNIDPALYEAATIDGANRIQQTVHITFVGLRMTVVLMAVLSLGNVLNAGFDQVYNLYSPIVYETGDIMDTFVYRLGLLDAQYGAATAVGLFKSLVSLLFISASYFAAYRFADYRIF
ncbi:MAG: ABC transporter permease subunit [Treponema sp.]|nr:ABC transporter permease subunit [Treponema sp.]